MNKINHRNIQRSVLRWLIMGTMFLFLSNDMSATHIVGGDFTYTRLDDGTFEIKLTVRRDCLNGEENFDTLANVYLYHEDGTPLDYTFDNWTNGRIDIPFMGSDTIEEVIISDCGFEGAQVCVREANYIDTISLPANFGHGFILAYERCCRNSSLNNILEPLETGTTKYIEIPFLAFTEGNSSPRFNSWPDLYVCENEQLVFDHGATDPDGDELRYKLCIPSNGASIINPLPLDPIEEGFPPASVVYDNANGYSISNMMGGVPLVIDQMTGELTAIPNQNGQYLIGVCVEEWRDGVKIGEVRRDFEYNVRTCVSFPLASFDAPIAQCDGNLVVDFTNESSAVLLYQWNFNYPSNDPAFLTNEENPTFTFPAEGTYTVQLQAFRGTDECSDEFFQDITVTTADIDADFQVSIGECLNDDNVTLSLSDLSIDNSVDYDIEEAEWTIDQGGNILTATGLNSVVDVNLAGGDVVINLLVTSSSGCTAATSQTIELDNLVAVVDFDFTANGCPTPETLQFTLTDLSTELSPDYTQLSSDWTIVSSEGTNTFTGPTVTNTLDPFQLISVTLEVVFDNNCTATITKEINLEDSLPESDFEVELIGCLENGLASFTLSDISNIIPGNSSNPTDWDWTIISADGSIINSDLQVVELEIDPNQVIDVSLLVNFENGCVANISKDLDLADLLPVANYVLTPESCPDDGTVDVVIEDASTNADGVSPVSIDWLVGPISNIQSFMGSSIALNVPKDSLIYLTQVVLFSNGCIDTLTEQIIPGPFAVLNFNGDPVFVCGGEEVAILINSNPDFTYTFDPETGLDFNNGNHNPIFIGLEDATYNVTVTDGLCTVEGSIDVDVEESLELTIEGEEFSCVGEVNLIASGGIGGGEYEWTLASDLNTVVFTGENLITTFDSNSETYVVNFISDDGCPSIAESFTVSLLVIDIELIEPFQVCSGDSIQFVVLNNDPNQTLMFEWEDNIHITAGESTDMPTIVVGEGETDPFELPFVVTNELGCILMDTLDVVIAETPVLTFNSTLTECGELEVCFDIPVDFFGFSLWNFGDLTTTDDTSLDMAPCYTYPDFGTYTVTLSNVSGICQAEPVTVEVIINPQIVINELPDFTVCDGNEVTLTADTNLDSEAYAAIWCNAAGDTLFVGGEYVFVPTEDIDVTLKVSDVNDCNDMQTINVNVFDFDLDVLFPEVFCGGAEVPVTVTNNSDGDLSYVWGPADCVISGGDTANPVLTASGDNKQFTVTATNNETGCTMDFLYDIPVTEFDIDVDASPDTTINEGEDVDIYVLGSEEGDTFEWSNGNMEEAQTVMPTDTTIYTVTVTDENGCTDTAEITINVRKPECDETDVYLPNAFSPNGDGVNDILYVRSNFIESMELIIYNRWHQEVFRTTDQSIGWDGTFGGEILTPDAYAYFLDVVCINAVEYTNKGNVSILR